MYRWIRYFADQQPQKADPNKARPKAEAPQLVKKPEAKAPAGSTPMAPSTDTAAAPAVVQPSPDSPQQQLQQQPAAQTAAAPAPVVPEPEVSAPVAPPLRPTFVVEPSIPREMRDETIKSSVLLSFTVQQDGTVASPTIITGNNRRLNRSALGAISQWRFEPIPTERVAQIEFEFRQE